MFSTLYVHLPNTFLKISLLLLFKIKISNMWQPPFQFFIYKIFKNLQLNAHYIVLLYQLFGTKIFKQVATLFGSTLNTV